MVIEVKVPSPGESITEVELGPWLVEDGAHVEMDDELVEINSDKATLVLPAEDEGVLKILKVEGDVVEIGEVIATLDTEAAGAKPAADKTAPASEEQAPVTADTSSGKSTYATGVPSPSADKLMKDSGVKEGDVAGSGRDGRVTKADVVEHLKNRSTAPAESAKPKEESKPAAPATPIMGGSREVSRKRMSPLRRKIADRLVSVKNETAMLTTFNEVDMTEIMALRSKYKEKFKDYHETGLGFMGFFVKACCEAIKHFPAVNSQIEGTDQVLFDYVDVGIAVSTQRGLVVPNIRNAESMSIAQIERTIRAYAAKARDNKITIDDMMGGTFTITNGGVFGSMLSTPILNPPQSAILGMHNIVQRPMAINGEVKIRPIMYVALSYDHRIVDGKGAVSFLFKVKEFLEDPARLLLGM
ncbi:MAG TPA: 2-oxoglutarate dehydrogenase complex dihydrolipoyllysine-residue succinyltransferase [Bacteroidetes bacterium]|nr:2-oxoglutarate dehydrogenase complex dihydrolipoyllysine-residue succinyltransferase [Bacteroidota bacterium]